jgi:hypothetical protein
MQELISIFAKFKIAASATSMKELKVLQQCCNSVNVSHSASSKKDLRPVLD